MVGCTTTQHRSQTNQAGEERAACNQGGANTAQVSAGSGPSQATQGRRRKGTHPLGQRDEDPPEAGEGVPAEFGEGNAHEGKDLQVLDLHGEGDARERLDAQNDAGVAPWNQATTHISHHSAAGWGLASLQVSERERSPERKEAPRAAGSGLSGRAAAGTQDAAAASRLADSSKREKPQQPFCLDHSAADNTGAQEGGKAAAEGERQGCQESCVKAASEETGGGAHPI